MSSHVPDDHRPPSGEPASVESPSADQMEGAPGPRHSDLEDGQLGPDELPDPDEVLNNRSAKLNAPLPSPEPPS